MSKIFRCLGFSERESEFAGIITMYENQSACDNNSERVLITVCKNKSARECVNDNQSARE